MKTLITAALAALSLALAPAAVADGHVGCSNPCVVDEDGTQGDFVKGEAGWFGDGTFGPFHGTHATLDDTNAQDMESYDTDQGTWPIEPDGNVIG